MRDRESAGSEWPAHWPTVASGMVGMSFYAMLTYQFGLFIQPLEQAFGWSRGGISLGLAIFTVAAVVFGPVVGMAIDRFGSRVIAIAGVIVTAPAFAALSLADGSLTRWYLTWAAIAIGALGVKSTVWTAGVSSLFTAGRGLALALVLCGSALAQSLAPLVANWIIAGSGWRDAYRWIGLGWGAITLVLVLAGFFDAHDRRRTRATANAAAVAPPGGLTVRQAARDSRILRIGLANLVMSAVGAGVQVHMVPLLSGYGIARTAAAEMAATAGIAGIAGKLLTGWLLDRIQGNVIPAASFGIAAIGYLLLLAPPHGTAMLVAGIMILGYASGAALQVTTYLIGRYAGLRNFGTIYGTIGSMLMLGTSLGPWLAGTVFDRTGSYAALLIVAVPVALLTAACFVGLGPYPMFAERDGAADALSAVARPPGSRAADR